MIVQKQNQHKRKSSDIYIGILNFFKTQPNLKFEVCNDGFIRQIIIANGRIYER